MGMGWKTQEQKGTVKGWQPVDTASPACESGAHTLMQTHPTLFQVSMADLCLVPQVANAER